MLTAEMYRVTVTFDCCMNELEDIDDFLDNEIRPTLEERLVPGVDSKVFVSREYLGIKTFTPTPDYDGWIEVPGV